MSAQITVFTPTYNRVHLLSRLYKSLKKQNNDKFEWLIIDDGSTDNTKETVRKWIEEGIIPIRYIKQENQGMYAAHNKAYDNISTELNMCIDSDDYLKSNAINEILEFWNKKKKENIAGIVAYDCDLNDRIIGNEFPVNIEEEKLYNLYKSYGVYGDKKLVYRSDIICNYRYPVDKNERFIPSTYIYNLIDYNYNLLILRKKVCVVDYQNDGMSKSERKRLILCPNNSSKYFISCLPLEKNKRQRVLICSRILAFNNLSKSYIKIYSLREYINVPEYILAFIISKVLLFSIYKPQKG
jgi:glycosyltransferase involved in cell wall biosynthesis